MSKSEFILCPMCNGEVEELKPNCHIIPKWMHKSTKAQGGGNILATTLGDNRSFNRGKNKDLMGQYWCSDCEANSQKYDNEAKLYLVLNNKVESTFSGLAEKVIYKKFSLLQKFIFLVLIRWHLYRADIGENFLGPYFEKLRKSVFSEEVDDEEFPFFITKLENSEGIITSPQKDRIDGLNVIEFIAEGYLFTIKLDKRPQNPYDTSLRIKNEEVNYHLVIDFYKTQRAKMLASIMKELRDSN